MFHYTTQGIYLNKNIEGFADINTNNLECDKRITQLSSSFDTKFNEQKNALDKSMKDLLNEKEECVNKITEIKNKIQIDKTNNESAFNEFKNNSENNIKQLTIDKEDLIKKVEGQKSCDLLIKQSYSDFEQQYQTQKNTYEGKIKEQKENTDNTMKQFLKEKEDWTKQFDFEKKESTNTLQQEKDKLDNIKKIFEDKIKKLELAIAEITLDIKKI